jgi:flagellar basal body-associated protein FliL
VKVLFLNKFLGANSQITRRVKDEDGSISLLIIGLFVITVATLLVITNIASIAIAQRTLLQASEAAVQQGMQSLDLKAYYVGEGGTFSGLLNSGEVAIPIECNSANSAIREELGHWNNSNSHLLRREIRNIWMSKFDCDGTSVGITTSAFAVLPLQIPFVNLNNIELHTSVGATNTRSKGFYLFGIRIS